MSGTRRAGERGVAIAIVVMAGLLTGCANHFTWTLETRTKLGASVFVEPGRAKTAYVEVKTVTGKPEMTLTELAGVVAAKGYRLLENPDEAQVQVQANTVYCEKAKPGMTVETVLAGGTGLTLGTLGGMALASSRASVRDASLAGLAGAAAGLVLGVLGSKLTEDDIYLCVADVRLSERRPGGERKVQQTRVAAQAQRMWLSAERGVAAAKAQLVEAIGGLL